MKSFIQVNKSYKNEGIELTVSCKGTDIVRHCFVTWKEKLEDKIERLTKEIETELLGKTIDLKDIKVTRGCTRDKDLNVIMSATYIPFDITTYVETKYFKNETQARSQLLENLFDLIWEENIKKRKHL